MESGDGLLVRVRARHGALGIRASELRALVQLAAAHGNGLLEVTRRARLQVRGVRAESLLSLQRSIVELGLAADSAELERSADAVIVNPWSGLSPAFAELDATASSLERALADSRVCEGASSKLAVSLDSGYALREIAADIHVNIEADRPDRASIHVATGTAQWSHLGECDIANVANIVVALLERVRAAKNLTRMRELVEAEGLDALRVRATAEGLCAKSEHASGALTALRDRARAMEPVSERAFAPSGSSMQRGSARATCDSRSILASPTAHLVSARDASSSAAAPSDEAQASNEAASPSNSAAPSNLALPSTFAAPSNACAPAHGARWLELGLAFGSGDRATWDGLADIAERFGIGEVRVTPSRTVIVPGVAPARRTAALELARVAGWITDPSDPLLRVAACPGSPACSSAGGETRTFARELAPLLAAGESLHVSGCAKGCAHSGAASITVVRRATDCSLGFGLNAAQTAETAGLALSEARTVLSLRSHPSHAPARTLARDPSTVQARELR